MFGWGKIKKSLETGEHTHFLWTVLEWFGLDHPIKAAFIWCSPVIGAALTYGKGQPLWVDFLAALACLALMAVGANAWEGYRAKRRAAAELPAVHPYPATTPRPIERDVWLRDAVYYVAFGSWTNDVPDDPAHTLSALYRARDAVRQAARDAKLPTWGREGRYSGTLEPMQPEYWKDYTINEYDLLKGGPEEVATVAETRGWHPPGVLHHLMTSKAKVEELWPRQQRESRETPIWRAVAHVRLAINDSAHDKCYPATLTALRQAALDGKIRLRGRRELDVRGSQTFSDVSSDIPAEYWRVSVIGPMATSDQGIGYPHTNPETVYAWGPKGVYEKKRYADLTVNMQEIERLWPSR